MQTENPPRNGTDFCILNPSMNKWYFHAFQSILNARLENLSRICR